MPDAAISELIATRLVSVRAVWGAQLSTLAVLGAVLVMAGHPREPAGPALVWAMGAVAVALVPAVFFVRRWMLGGTLALLDPDDLRPSQSLDGAALLEASNRAIGRYTVGTIAGLALSEAIALCGMLAALKTGDLRFYVFFAAFAATLMVVQFPRVAGLRALLTPEARAGLDRALR